MDAKTAYLKSLRSNKIDNSSAVVKDRLTKVRRQTLLLIGMINDKISNSAGKGDVVANINLAHLRIDHSIEETKQVLSELVTYYKNKSFIVNVADQVITLSWRIRSLL